MLAAANRLSDATSFREVTRRGRRATTRSLVVHVLTDGAAGDDLRPPVAGLIVSRAVGNAVVRNQVKRRLRHVLRGSLAALPPGSRVVVRALPAAASATSAALARDLSRGLERVG